MSVKLYNLIINKLQSIKYHFTSSKKTPIFISIILYCHILIKILTEQIKMLALTIYEYCTNCSNQSVLYVVVV